MSKLYTYDGSGWVEIAKNGNDGSAATIAVGTVTTGNPGTEVIVTNSGTTSAAVLDFTIPQGEQGAAGTGSGDMLAATYDPQAIAGDAFDVDNHTDGTTNKVYSATDKTKLAGIEASADVTDAGNVGSSIHGATAKTTPVDADELPLIDSVASNVLKKLTWINLKATLKTYLDTLYQPLDSDLTTWAGKTAPTGTVVGTSDTQTLTSKTLTSPSISSPTITSQFGFGAHTAYFTETDNGNSGTADTIDWGTSNKQKSTLTGNCTFTFTAPSGPCTLLLKLVQDGTGSRTVTWPSTVHWPSGTAPTLTTTASKVDIISFYYDGTTYFGNSALNYTA
jgi:hypothetical protein